jgi:hypothetical protein
MARKIKELDRNRIKHFTQILETSYDPQAIRSAFDTVKGLPQERYEGYRSLAKPPFVTFGATNHSSVTVEILREIVLLWQKDPLYRSPEHSRLLLDGGLNKLPSSDYPIPFLREKLPAMVWEGEKGTTTGSLHVPGYTGRPDGHDVDETTLVQLQSQSHNFWDGEIARWEESNFSHLIVTVNLMDTSGGKAKNWDRGQIYCEPFHELVCQGGTTALGLMLRPRLEKRLVAEKRSIILIGI